MENLKDKLSLLLNQPKLSQEDKQWLTEYIRHSDSKELLDLLEEQFNRDNGKEFSFPNDVSKSILSEVHLKLAIKGNKKNRTAKILKMWAVRITVAASIGLMLIGYYKFSQNGSDGALTARMNRENYQNDIAPGGEKAILTLSDGSKITLDDTDNGTIAKQGNCRVLKLNGKLSYKPTAINDTILYNTITTPRGGKFQIVLSDGSEVWLNAESSLHFPITFQGKQRRVKIEGEGYFEVAKNAQLPFVVEVNGAEIQVLGTHFNVTAYKDETDIRTTLLEGSIKFTSKTHEDILTPGQQSRLTKSSGEVKVVKDVNVASVIGWKNGMFRFENAEIEAVMREISRWYDVEVIYKKPIDDLFFAEIPRNTNLSNVLKALELTGKVQFMVKGKTIIVQ